MNPAEIECLIIELGVPVIWVALHEPVVIKCYKPEKSGMFLELNHKMLL